MEHIFDNIKICYYKKSLTIQQHEFINDLINSIGKNKRTVLEFPPILDKDYLFCSCLYSLSRQESKKFLVISSNSQRVTEILKIFTKISKISKKKANLKIMPFLDRRLLCREEAAIKEISFTNDNYFCYKYTASWIPDNQMCSLFKNTRRDSLNKKKTLEILYEDQNYNDQYLINKIHKDGYCPYYFLLNNLEEADIIISTYKEFFDVKNLNFLQNLIKTKEYCLIFDNCENIDNSISEHNSINIDEVLISTASIQALSLKEKIFNEHKNLLNDNYRQDYNKLKNAFNLTNEDCSYLPENEVFNYSPLCVETPQSFPGTIRTPINYLNHIIRLIVFLKNKVLEGSYSKQENIYSIHQLQYLLCSNEFVEFKTLKSLLKRFYFLMNELKCVDMNEYIHLYFLNVFFTKLAHVKDGYIMNYQKLLSEGYNQEYFCLELNMFEPYIIFNEVIERFQNSILIGGGIGKLDYFKKTLKYNAEVVKSYYDDSNNEKLYLLSISSNNLTNIHYIGDIIIKICCTVPDGVIVYFSSLELLEAYICLFNDIGLFNKILDYKLVFIEEKNSQRLATILCDYKNACENGRGGILFLSSRNKASYFDCFQNHLSRAIIFVGFPIENKERVTYFKFKMENFKKEFQINEKEYLLYDTLKLFSSKVSNKISSMYDKKIIAILDDKIISDEKKEYLPQWLIKVMHIDYDKNEANTEERLRNMKKFLNN